MSFFRWTPERIDLLTELYLKEVEPELIAKCLKTDVKEVKWKASKLDIKPKAPRAPRGNAISEQWTEERVELLKKLWGEGKSFAVIARTLGRGLTRNAVCGKIHRLGLASRATKYREPSGPVRQKRREKPKASTKMSSFRAFCEQAPLSPPVTSDVARKSFTELMPSDCKWPVGDPLKPGFGFCAAERVPGLAYCAAHAMRAFHSIEPASRAATQQASSQVDSETRTERENEPAG